MWVQRGVADCGCSKVCSKPAEWELAGTLHMGGVVKCEALKHCFVSGCSTGRFEK